SFMRGSSTGRAVRYPHDSGTARASRREYDDDLHARAQSRRARCAKPPRSTRPRSRAPVNPICRRSRRWRGDIEFCISRAIPLARLATTHTGGGTSKHIEARPTSRYTAAFVYTRDYRVRPTTCWEDIETLGIIEGAAER